MGLGAVIYTHERLTDIRSTDSFTGYVFRREAVAACDVLMFFVLFCTKPCHSGVGQPVCLAAWCVFPKFWKNLYWICDYNPHIEVSEESHIAKDCWCVVQLLVMVMMMMMIYVKLDSCALLDYYAASSGNLSPTIRKLRFPDFMTTAQVGGKVVSLTHRPLFTPRKYSWYSFLLESESTPGP